jgi:hypothetical protein
MSSAPVSSAEWASVQAQLVALKGELHDAREREARATKAAEAAKEKGQAMEQQMALAEDAAAAATGRSRASSESNGSGTSGGSSGTSAPSKLSSLMSSVKRNSQTLGSAIAAAAHAGVGAASAVAAPASSSSSSAVEQLQSELNALRAQHANELEERAEQTAALKQNLSHLHKKSLDLEKQNATLMTHLSNLEEERHSLAEKREKELKKRQAREEARKQRIAAGESAQAAAAAVAEEDDDDEDDLDAARAKWATQRAALEAQLATAQSELAQRTADLSARDAQVEKLRARVADEEKNFERILSKMADKDQELMQLRDELDAKAKQLKASPASSPQKEAPQPRDSPMKSPSSLRSFFNKGKDLVSSPVAAASPSPQSAHAAVPFPQLSPSLQPSSSPRLDAASSSQPHPGQPEGMSLGAAASDASAAASSSGVSLSNVPHSSTIAAPTSPSSPSPAAPEPAPWSASQPLAEQVASLQAELASLRVMNEHLITSVQKKDSLLTKERDEAERIMAKLAEKEVQLMQLREAQSSVEDVQREVKKRDADIKRLKEQLSAASAAQADAVSKAANSSASAAELRAATEAVSVMQSEYEGLKDTLENTKDQLFLAETQLIDKQKLLSEQAEQLRELRASADGHESSMHSLMAAKAKGERDMNEHVDYLERKCIAEISEWERKYDADMEHAQKERDSMQAQLRDAQREMNEARAEETAVRGELIQLRAEHEALVVSERTLSSSCEKLTRELSELKANSSIETRKRNRLVQELKTALKAELLRAKDALARLKHAEDDLVTIKVMQQHQIAPTGSFALTVDPASASTGGGSGGGMDGSDTSSSTRASSHTPNAASSSSSSMLSTPSHSKGVEQEVANALAQKLAQLENDKFVLVKKQRALEEHNDMLQADVMQKKEMIRNLVRRIEIGSLTTTDDSGMQQMASLSPESRQVLFEKMEVLLQETTLQNAQYKNNLQSMGAEITKLMEELEQDRHNHAVAQKQAQHITTGGNVAHLFLIFVRCVVFSLFRVFRLDEKSSELSQVREELDMLKDEEEIARQSAADSLALTRSTEGQLKKIERTLVALTEGLERQGTLEQQLNALEDELQQVARQVIANAQGGGAARRLSNPAIATATAAASSADAQSGASSDRAAVSSSPVSPSSSSAATSPSASSSSKSKKALRAAAKAQADAEKAARDAQQKQEEDARIQHLENEVGEQQRRKQTEDERARAAAEEDARRDSLLAEADALSAGLLSPASALRSPGPPRSSSALLRDVDSEPPSAVTSPAARRASTDGGDDSAASAAADTDRSTLRDAED